MDVRDTLLVIVLRPHALTVKEVVIQRKNVGPKIVEVIKGNRNKVGRETVILILIILLIELHRGSGTRQTDRLFEKEG